MKQARDRPPIGNSGDVGASGRGALPAYPPRLRHSTEHSNRVYELQAETGARGTAGHPAVYIDPGSGQRMVPSGRLFVRFAEGVQAQSRRQQIEAAGYRLLSVPSHAPHAAWVEAADGRAASALSGVARLEALAQVANVEPQWLAPRVSRG